MKNFINEQFPYIHNWTEAEYMDVISESLFEFGKCGYLKSLDSMTVGKIVNQSMLIENNWAKNPNRLIYSFWEN